MYIILTIGQKTGFIQTYLNKSAYCLHLYRLSYSAEIHLSGIETDTPRMNYDKLEDVNGYRTDGGFSVFITGSNSYLLSGELVTKLIGRYLEFELFTLRFEEYEQMKKFYGKPIAPNGSIELNSYILEGGFPRTIQIDDIVAKRTYVTGVINEIFEKDIKRRVKTRDKAAFEAVKIYIINSFGATTSIKSLTEALKKTGLKITGATVTRYITALTDAKIYEFNLDNSKVLSVIPVGESIEFSNMSQWVNTRYNNIKGWINLEDLELSTNSAKSNDIGYKVICKVIANDGAKIREFNSDNSEILSVVPFGDTVEADFFSEWESIKYNGINGWVMIKDFKFLSPLPASNNEKTEKPSTPPLENELNTIPSETNKDDILQTETENNNTNYWVFLIVVAIFIIPIVVLFLYFSRIKCPLCGKRNCSEIKREKLKSEKISINKEETIKHYSKEQTAFGQPKLGQGYQPESVSVRKYTVPGVRTFYNVTYSCQDCGETFSRKQYKDSEEK